MNRDHPATGAPIRRSTRPGSSPQVVGSLAHVQDGSRKAIIAAFFANLGIAVAKFVGFLLTGSAHHPP